MSPGKSKTADGLKILRQRHYEGDPKREKDLEEARVNARVARQIQTARTTAGLTQRQLADLIGTTASVICRLENDDYQGHSLSILQRIAAALEMRVEIRLIPTCPPQAR